MVSFNYSKLRGRIVEKYGTQEAFANALGVTRTTVNNKMNCNSNFSHEDMIKWCELLEIDLSDVSDYFFCLNS